VTTLFLALLAGVLSVLSPCVLPLLPLVLGAAASEGRFGPAMLAAGMTLSFVAIGMFVALVGFSIGLDQGFFRFLAALMLLAVGAVLVMPVLQGKLAVAAGPMSGWVDNRFGRFNAGGNAGQFATGVLLGAVWSPCVGPTLGAASLLAAQGENLLQVTATMTFFGIGAALPLLLLGTLSREVLMRWRSRMLATGQTLKTVLGLLLITAGTLILTGFDKALEATLVELSPLWLTALTTRF
jgi:cytochrome c-type biogenesis protein